MHKLYEKVLELYYHLRDGAEGQTMTEYAIILAVIAIAAGFILASGLGTAIGNTFTNAVSAITNVS
ncbi:MAG TPA: hypothetical protein VJM69_07040 [Dehalococcoidia bacterium]|nr:hypothetical protein [Dehalococcoidia bacterium]